MWKANLLRSVFAGIGALKHGAMAVVWTMRVMRSELWVCELCIFPLVPTLNHRVHSNFWKAWRFISVVSPSPCDSLDRRFRAFSAAPEGATKPFFKPQNGIDILENHESAPRLPLLSIVQDCTDIWWKEACTASYFWTFISLTCSAQACWLYGWLVSSFVSAPTWYSFVWTLAILIWISSIHIMNWHRTKNRIWFQESAGSATSSWSLQKCQPQLIRDSTWPRSVWKSTHFRPGGDCNRWGGENDGKIDGKMMVCLKHTLKSLKPTKVFGSTSRVLFDFLGKSAMDKPHPRISTTCQISDFKV